MPRVSIEYWVTTSSSKLDVAYNCDWFFWASPQSRMAHVAFDLTWRQPEILMYDWVEYVLNNR